MIVVKIFQGPGNQMFQVAYGLSVAKSLNTELKLDLSWYDEYSHHRQFILNKFNLNLQVATEKEIYDIVTCNASNFITYQWNRLNRMHLRPYYQRPQVIEPVDRFDLNYTKILDNTYVEGYFASREFFERHENFAKQQLTFKDAPSDINKKMIEQIRSENAVAVSFRLGDFLAYPLHNICSLQYYERCIEYLTARYNNLKLYIFSDDLNWVKTNFKTTLPTVYMDFNAPDYMGDLRLLTHFKFHIIPNSTFSWWGAELADNKDKIVLAPQYWLNPDEHVQKDAFDGKVVDFSHVVPNDWIKIPNMVEGDTYIA